VPRPGRKHGFVCPGVVAASLLVQAWRAANVICEFTTVEDVAEAALFFAAFESNALTGQSLVVSHGWFMQ
jgi:3-hydroxybutyrate dehydrogenase